MQVFLSQIGMCHLYIFLAITNDLTVKRSCVHLHIQIDHITDVVELVVVQCEAYKKKDKDLNTLFSGDVIP